MITYAVLAGSDDTIGVALFRKAAPGWFKGAKVGGGTATMPKASSWQSTISRQKLAIRKNNAWIRGCIYV